MARKKNQFFRFKQFLINQDKTAMKVCTDSCILGAWTNCADASLILDIGAGTGLLSLMLAQKCNAKIESIEIDEAAAEQANENFRQSPWASRLSVIQEDFRDFMLKETARYDLIISNPPFYTANLKSDNEARNKAMHSSMLELSELADGVSRLLHPQGKFSVLLPLIESEKLGKLLFAKGLSPVKSLRVRNSQGEAFIREVVQYSYAHTEPVTEILTIREESGDYSKDFKKYLEDYYLNF